MSQKEPRKAVSRAQELPAKPDPQVTVDSFWENVFVPATASIDENYFLLHRAGADSVWRERVYAYELYHQMRVCWKGWEHRDTYVLNGEVDKRGYRPVDDIDGKNPDFVVHQPGRHSENLVVIEVKTQEASVDLLKQDVKKLKAYMDHKELHYTAGLLLVVGPATVAVEAARKVAKTTGVMLAMHVHPTRPAERLA